MNCRLNLVFNLFNEQNMWHQHSLIHIYYIWLCSSRPYKSWLLTWKNIFTPIYIYISVNPNRGEAIYMLSLWQDLWAYSMPGRSYDESHWGKRPLRLVQWVICECLYGRLTHECLVFLHSGSNNIISGNTCQLTQGRNHISAVIVARPLCKINECQLGRNHINILTETRLSLSSVDLKYIWTHTVGRILITVTKVYVSYAKRHSESIIKYLK